MSIPAKYFRLKMRVVDGKNRVLRDIDATTAVAILEVQILNTSLLEKDAQIHVSLPSGTSALEFDNNGARSANWDEPVMRIPQNGTSVVRRALKRNGGAANPQERVQLNKVDHTVFGRWISIRTSRIPFAVYIQVT